MTQLLEWDAGAEAFCEAIEREASSMEENMSDADKNMAVAGKFLVERLSDYGGDAAPFLLGFHLGGLICHVGNAFEVMNLVDLAAGAYEAAKDAEGDTLEEAFDDAMARHLKAMAEARL